MCSHRYVLFAKQMRLLSPEVLWSPLHQTQTNKSRFLHRDQVKKALRYSGRHYSSEFHILDKAKTIQWQNGDCN